MIAGMSLLFACISDAPFGGVWRHLRRRGDGDELIFGQFEVDRFWLIGDADAVDELTADTQGAAKTAGFSQTIAQSGGHSVKVWFRAGAGSVNGGRGTWPSR
jgi:hypothetical protein